MFTSTKQDENQFHLKTERTLQFQKSERKIASDITFQTIYQWYTSHKVFFSTKIQ